jgi:diguanylate cyclase (GGDEF)-like protein
VLVPILIALLAGTGATGVGAAVLLHRALRASRRRFLGAFAGATSGMAIVALDGRVLRANAALAVLVGLEAEIVCDNPFADVVHLDDRAAFAAWLTEPSEPLSLRLTCADRSTAHVRMTASPIVRADGSTVLLLQLEDLTALAVRGAQQAVVASLGHQALTQLDVRQLAEDAVRAVRETLDALGVTIHQHDRDHRLVLLAADDDGDTAGARIAVEITVRGAAHGVVAARRRADRPFGPDDESFLQGVANILAAAIERLRSEEAVRRQALRDRLTGLPNRTLFANRLEHALARARRRGTRLAVLALDIDNFKSVNDGLGHEAGDELLVSIAPRLEGVLRESDTVARFGGDEFVVLCEDVDGEDAAVEVARRVLEAMARPFTLAGAETVFTGGNVGIALSRDGHERAEDLARDATAAMDRAKSIGSGRVELFDEELRAGLVKRLRIENALRSALEREELSLVYQPVVSLRDGRVSGVEALLRWSSAERGPVSPAEFIPVAEDSGLIVPIGRWVLEQACRDAARWNEGRAVPVPVYVNLSARQVALPELPEVVAEVLAETGIDPSTLGLEITESVLLEEAGSPLEQLTALKALGVTVVLDDFGTGYSSLGYLPRFPLDGVKLDRSFVAGLDEVREAAAIVAAVVQMGQALGLRVVAEGIEHRGQLRELVSLGCDLAQGYLLARPVPYDEVCALVRADRAWDEVLAETAARDAA